MQLTKKNKHNAFSSSLKGRNPSTMEIHFGNIRFPMPFRVSGSRPLLRKQYFLSCSAPPELLNSCFGPYFCPLISFSLSPQPTSAYLRLPPLFPSHNTHPSLPIPLLPPKPKPTRNPTLSFTRLLLDRLIKAVNSFIDTLARFDFLLAEFGRFVFPVGF